MSSSTTTAAQHTAGSPAASGVPAAPQTSLTTWERHEAGWPARDAGERARYRELDAGRPVTEREAGQ